MTFHKTYSGYNIFFSKKKVTDIKKFTAIKNETYGILSMDKLRSMKITNFYF